MIVLSTRQNNYTLNKFFEILRLDDIFSCQLRPWFINQLSKINNIHHHGLPQYRSAKGAAWDWNKLIKILCIPFVILNLVQDPWISPSYVFILHVFFVGD